MRPPRPLADPHAAADLSVDVSTATFHQPQVNSVERDLDRVVILDDVTFDPYPGYRSLVEPDQRVLASLFAVLEGGLLNQSTEDMTIQIDDDLEWI